MLLVSWSSMFQFVLLVNPVLSKIACILLMPIQLTMLGITESVIPSIGSIGNTDNTLPSNINLLQAPLSIKKAMFLTCAGAAAWDARSPAQKRSDWRAPAPLTHSFLTRACPRLAAYNYPFRIHTRTIPLMHTSLRRVQITIRVIVLYSENIVTKASWWCVLLLNEIVRTQEFIKPPTPGS